MSKLKNETSTRFDDIARIIASPIERREAIRLVSRVMGGSVLAALGLGGNSLFGQNASPCPTALQFLCGSLSGTHSCCVVNSQQCCTDIGAYCCPSADKCCHGVCCAGNQVCCGGPENVPRCCEPGQICCKGRCCTASPSASNPCEGARCS